MTLAQLAADPELSVKNGAELLDRLVKDIVAESAATYISVLQSPEQSITDTQSDANSPTYASDAAFPTAFSLPRFIPLLTERIHVINPFTRIFLVSWITLLDSIPDLELVTHLPTFLDGLFEFLSDPNQDVHVATQQALEGFLAEIKRIARVKRGIEESRKARPRSRTRSDSGSADNTEEGLFLREKLSLEESLDNTILPDRDSVVDRNISADGSWIPGQDVLVEHSRILEILIPFMDSSGGLPSSSSTVLQSYVSFIKTEEEIQLTALRWVDHFFEICPEDLLPFVPRLLSHVLPAIAHEVEVVRQAAMKVNQSLLGLIVNLSDDAGSPPMSRQPTRESTMGMGDRERPERTSDRRDSQARQSLSKESDSVGRRTPSSIPPAPPTPVPPPSPTPPKTADLDYSATVGALTLQFLNEHEQTRVVALEWLLMLHKKAPRKVSVSLLIALLRVDQYK